MASVVLLVVVMEVLPVAGGRKIGYRGPHAHVHRRRSGSIACAPIRSRGLGRLVGMVHPQDVFLFSFFFKVLISDSYPPVSM